MSNDGPLIFVDTNIFLDFYRATRSAEFRLLSRLKEVKDKIITSHQVEMEFQKNRQKLLSDLFDRLKLAQLPEISGLLAGTTESTEWNTALDQVKKNVKILLDSLSATLRQPATHDSVYQTAKEVFSFKSDFNLTYTKKEAYRIHRLAQRRFALGYPPRKGHDTSMGDALNWEWIVACAIKSERPVVLVSRDSDYGVRFKGAPHLNEWLRQEFSERVEGKSQITLTDSLASALKKIKVSVTKAERDAEEKLIETASTPRAWAFLAADFAEHLNRQDDQMKEALRRAIGVPGNRLKEILELNERMREEWAKAIAAPVIDQKQWDPSQ